MEHWRKNQLILLLPRIALFLLIAQFIDVLAPVGSHLFIVFVVLVRPLHSLDIFDELDVQFGTRLNHEVGCIRFDRLEVGRKEPVHMQNRIESRQL